MADPTPDLHEAVQADFSDYYEKALAPARAKEIEKHLESCDKCRAELAKFRDAVGALSGLHKMAAPQNFEKQVAETIHRRSAGRFFGRRAFGDRVPFELIAIVGLALALAIVLLIRFSVTGALHDTLRKDPKPPPVAPGAHDVVPKP